MANWPKGLIGPYGPDTLWAYRAYRPTGPMGQGLLGPRAQRCVSLKYYYSIALGYTWPFGPVVAKDHLYHLIGLQIKVHGPVGHYP